MKHRIDCMDAGTDCDFAVEASDEMAVMEAVKQHAKNQHDMDVSDDDVRGMMKKAA
jgi:predicted small metal-binding protein